ncbi:MAG TPA: vanadium-dependent haloperoxidase [Blastocatellia bacterium]|nr:vanadium-dependent haloperoxidase [Blastocatellia bacterium]
MLRKLTLPVLLSFIVPFVVAANLKDSRNKVFSANELKQEAPPADQTVNSVIQWNRTLLTIVRTPGAQPATIHSTRSFAIMHAAIYDAVNSILNTHKPYMIQPPGVAADASPDAAAAAAAHEVLVQLYPTFQSMLDSQLETSLAQVPDGTPKTSGMQLGVMVADQMLALRANDGSGATPPAFTPGMNPGDYQSTPPNFPKAAFTGWAQVTPFALAHANQFRPGPPPALTSRTYAKAFNEVMELGEDTSTARTPDQTEIGRFWGGAIQNYWNEIAQTAAIAKNLNVADTARLFALLNLTFADTVIAFYDAKYTYTFWRPITAIRAADTDGNPKTSPNPNWLALSNTAPDPSYPVAHAAISNAGSEVLAFFFDRDRINLDVTSETLPGVVRSFKGFSEAADEATISRVYAGQHFSFDLSAGKRLGRKVGAFVLENFLN